MEFGPVARTVPDLIREMAASAPDAKAIIPESGQPLSYSDLAKLVEAGASGLRALGVGRGSTVAVMAPNIVEWVPAVVGAQAAGAQVAAFNTFVKSYELTYLMEHSRAETLIVADRMGRHDLLEPLREALPELWNSSTGQWKSQRFPHLRSVVVIGDQVPSGALSWAALIATAAELPIAPEPQALADDVAVIVYTSGSTARPKAVPLTHGGIIENGFNIGERVGLTAADSVWLGSPLFWSFGVANALVATLSHGGALVLQAEYSAQAAADLISREACTAAYLLPTITHGLLALPAADREKLASLRTGVTIGRPDEVRAAAVDLGVSEICNVYGATENYGNCCVTPHDMPLEQRLVCQGPPLPGVQIRIANTASGAAPDAGEGELEVSGYLTTGYLGDPEQTKAAFTSDGWYRTGDIGRILPDGSFQFVTRATDMIKTAGINVSPAEVEDFIGGLPQVAEVVVVGTPDPIRGEVVVAFVRLAEGFESVGPRDLIALCKADVASYKVPSRIVVVDQLPKTTTGKISRLELKQWAGAGTSESDVNPLQQVNSRA